MRGASQIKFHKTAVYISLFFVLTSREGYAAFTSLEVNFEVNVLLAQNNITDPQTDHSTQIQFSLPNRHK